MGCHSCIFVLVVFLMIIHKSEEKRRYRWGFVDGRPLKDHYAKQVVGADSAGDCYANPGNYGVYRFNFTQPLDHFNTSNGVFWQQQVQWKNSTFKPRADGDIVFLLLGGEGPAPTTWMCFMNYTWTKLAIEHGAFMFQLEHRYFGTSTPTPDMSVPNLKWLTTEQAMADVNAFIPSMNAKFNFKNPKWVAFGGSYPGTLAALLRKFYPNITNGNIASSAPLWAKVDFWEYALKMEQAIQWESINNASNGVGECTSQVRAAFADARNKMYTVDGQNEYNTVFNIEPKLGTTSTPDLDATNFLSTIFSSFQGIVQYTFDDRNQATINKTDGLNLANLCHIIDGPPSDQPPLARKQEVSYAQRLKQVYDWEQSWDTPGYDSSWPFNNNYWADLAPFMNTSFLGGNSLKK